MPDDTTAHLNLALPHPDNLLSQDVVRLRSALTGVDAAFATQDAEVAQALATALAQVDASLDTTTAALARQLRRVRIMNQLLGLNI